MKETITRSLTGIVFIALVILSLVLHPISYLVLFSIVCTVSWIEMVHLFPGRLPPGMQIPGAVFICGCFILGYFIAAGYLSGLWMFSLPAALLLLVFIPWAALPVSHKSIPLFVLSLLYLSAGFTLMNFLAFLPGDTAGYSPRWILYTFYFLWMNDTMAYVWGRMLGKHPIWPSVSPAKTWEGAMGGALFTIGLAMIFSRYLSHLSLWEWTGFAIVVILFGSLGDFLESWIKRKAGVKDSGRLLPGHGGVLDRFDSFLLSVPFVSIFLYFTT